MKTLGCLLVILIISNLAYAEPISLKEGKVKFETPKGFKELSREQILLKFPRGNPPSKAYGNENLEVSISIVFSPENLSEAQLIELKSSLEQTFPRLIPNLVWKKREMIKVKGTIWVHFEFSSTAASNNADIHNNIYITSFEGKMLSFNFNSTKKQYKKYSTALIKSFESIAISK